MRLLALASLFLLSFSLSLRASDAASGLDVVHEMNFARQHPDVYATYIAELRGGFDGKIFHNAGKLPLRTAEGVAAFDEAIHFLRHIHPLAPLEFSSGLSSAAREHVADQAAGGFGHRGSNRSAPADRINRYGTWSGGWGENICYGRSSAREIVLALIVDDGLRSRKHRKNVFNSAFNFAGAAVGFHPRFRTVCSIYFAAGHVEKTAEERESPVARN